MKPVFVSALGAAGIALLSLSACKKDTGSLEVVDDTKPATAFTCAAPAEGTNYSIYPLGSGGAGVGDVMPYYDAASNTSYIYYLRDIWNDATQQHHPVNAFTTTDFISYAQTATGEVLSSNSATCAQDFAIGTGSVVQRNGIYYFFYTGNNPNAGGCTNQKEGLMLATATGPGQKFTKNTSFATIYAPSNQGYDFNDNFRDPYVYFDAPSNQYLMLIAARKDVGGGNFKGIIAKYTSANLLNWSYQGVLYDGGADNFFNMECPSVFKLGSTYYLLFSDQGSQNAYYRKSNSLNGPWSAPSGTARLDGNGFYAPKLITDKYGDNYLMGWVNRQEGNSDTGNRMFGGNLVVHKLYQQANGDLAVTIPHTLKANLEAKPITLVKNAQAGTITAGTNNTYTLASTTSTFLNSVVFNPIAATKFKVSTTINYASAAKDFGFMLGACDNYNGFYSLRFIPSQNRFSLDKTDRRNVTVSSTSVDVPFKMSPNTDYTVDIVEENSVVVVYLNNTAALTCRVYRAPQSSWGLFADNATATFKNLTVTTAN
ncbi:glycoside hydrolase family 32 protein [Hymenobacter nivis]|uniref:beta-fructofuranosidase n=1 Tax=Hymenobacter nivis TaxID=1850093 RepID=A0A502GRP7_9BACT|nr:glycoside hydrolase family 32 protein [Hymenobacter nivis]TPG63666.1 DUF4975 domain-containing protein [Hymenobacter nivis]